MSTCTDHAYLSDSRVTNISESFIHNMVAKTSCHLMHNVAFSWLAWIVDVMKRCYCDNQSTRSRSNVSSYRTETVRQGCTCSWCRSHDERDCQRVPSPSREVHRNFADGPVLHANAAPNHDSARRSDPGRQNISRVFLSVSGLLDAGYCYTRRYVAWSICWWRPRALQKRLKRLRGRLGGRRHYCYYVCTSFRLILYFIS